MGLFLGRRSKRRSSRRRDRPSLLRFFGPTVTLVGLLGAAGTWVMGGFDFASLDPPGGLIDDSDPMAAIARPSIAGDAAARRSEGGPVIRQTAAASNPNPRIRIATFNIKQFGPKKAADPTIMDRVARLVSRFDVIAIQEVHGGDAEPIRALIKQLRQGGVDYAATVSEKIGTSERYQEAYAFVWNERTVEMIPGSDYVVADPGKRMAREPMACSFRCIVDPQLNRPPFSFTLINAHTSPSQVANSATLNEMDVLDDVYLSIADFSGRTLAEDDIILLGDLNVDADHLRELGRIPDLRTVDGLRPTNMNGDRVYDHILVHGVTTGEYLGRSGVIDVVAALSITPDEAAAISDHRPVWAEFDAFEAGVQTASNTRIIR